MCSYFQNGYLFGTKSALTRKTFFLKKITSAIFMSELVTFMEDTLGAPYTSTYTVYIMNGLGKGTST